MPRLVPFGLDVFFELNPFNLPNENVPVTQRSKVKQKGLFFFLATPYLLLFISMYDSFPVGTSGKEPACLYRRCKKLGFDPWIGKVPWRRKWQPTLVFMPGESHGQGSLVGYSS